MTSNNCGVNFPTLLMGCVLACSPLGNARGELPSPALQGVFPPGGQAGKSVSVTFSGISLEELRDVRSSIPHLVAKKAAGNQFILNIPPETPAGVYDLRAVGRHGMSSPRSFVVGQLAEQEDKEPNDAADVAQKIPVDVVINGRIDKPGDVDCFQFAARGGQRIVLECQARRIDSQLRAVLEVYDAAGKRLAVNRGHTGIDPLVDFRVPADGTYVVKIFDLSYLGSPNHFYRLDIDTHPRVEFAFPCVVERGKSTKVRLYGRNLTTLRVADLQKTDGNPELESIEVEVTPPAAGQMPRVPVLLSPNRMAPEVFACHHPGSQTPVLIGLTDVPVVATQTAHHRPEQALDIPVPCEVNGQLANGDETQWYAIRARRGEALWLEAYGERIGSPVELGVAVLDSSGNKELARLFECINNPGQARFPTAHTDPAGRWVAPADGRYLIVVRNRIGGTNRDPRRLYRLSVRREEPDFQITVIPRRTDQETGLNVGAGGREMAELIVIRQRGLTDAIRVSAKNLPPGIQCPDVWIGPGQDRAPLVITARRDCPAFAGTLELTGHANIDGVEITRPVRGGTLIWPGQPSSYARLTQEIPLATGPEAVALFSASIRERATFQDSVLDVSFDLEQRIDGSAGAVHVSGVGLPRGVANAIVTLPPGKTKGTISFFLPESLAPGNYTFVLQAEVEPAKGDKSVGKNNLKLFSNPVTIDLKPSRISLEIDPRSPRTISRGKIIQLQYTATRKHGFIGKIHTELVSPNGDTGVRGRGVTFVGQTDSGTIQIIATDNAPLGRQIFLRLEAVGTLEDQPVYFASRFVELEITE